MSGDFTLDVRIDSFNGAMNDMAEALQGTATKKQIVDEEVGRILSATIRRVHTATAASIAASMKSTHWTTYPAAWAGGGGKRYLLTNRYPDALWNRIQAQMQASLARKLAGAGWARKAWWELGVLIGQKVDDLGSAQAQIKGRDAAANVSAQRMDEADSYTLMIQNDSPLIQFSDGRQAFFAAVAGRLGYFHQNLAHGVFQDVDQVLRKYPGMQLTQLAA